MSDLSGVILSVGGEGGGAIVARDPNDPDYFPDATVVDLSLRKDFSLGWKNTRLGVSFDALNVFNENAVNNAGFRRADYGRVYSLETPRTYRLGLRFDF